MSPKDFQTIRHALSHIEYALPGLSDAHEALTRIDRQAKTLADWAVLREDTSTDWLKGYEAARAWVCMQLGLSGPPAEISEAPVAAASDAPPKASWEDSRTQKVYEVLVNDNYPPRGSDEHWEGWKARLVVDALFPEQPQAEKPLAELEPASSYVQPVPDHCDRIVWRNHYYHLPLKQPQAEAVPLRCPDSIDGLHDFGPDGGQCANGGCTARKPFVSPKQAEAVPQGYALVSIDALKDWGKYDEVQAACQYLVAQPPICPTCDDVGFCIKPSECAKEIERMQGGDL